MPDRTTIEATFERHRARFLSEWEALLRFPSISTEPAHDADCRACAEWLVDHIGTIGFSAELLETPSKPVVYAKRPGRRDGPRVLFYGHYDVQPVDPLELWTSPPFEPLLRGDRLYARGAEDNKGQLFYALKAMETLAQMSALDLPIAILLEGEEESGSEGIAACLPNWRERVQADLLMVTDTNTILPGVPTIVMGLRGIVHATVSLSGPDHDLHSGIHGGLAPNPAQEMARLVASLHDNSGRIAVPGFYGGVRTPSPEERRLARTPPFDAEAYRSRTGVPPNGGERDIGPAERVGFRPSIDINGIHSGYGGAGTKTIIPSCATAKLTARLVPDQDPDACLAAIVGHLQRHAPEGLILEVTESGIGGPGFRLDPTSPTVARATAVLDRLTGHETALHWEGASIPIVSELARTAGAEPLLVGFGTEEDRAHAPNESFSIEQFRLGYLYVAMLLSSL